MNMRGFGFISIICIVAVLAVIGGFSFYSLQNDLNAEITAASPVSDEGVLRPEEHSAGVELDGAASATGTPATTTQE
ncbi:MAG: hypothetical protein HYT22_04150 [Candidatus Niyogibacteria bacterium]|nr:hypothetical protein [Candidatus Niyogibacteria bacterium]